MPIAGRWAYFDHAAVAPLPEPSRLAMHGQISDQAEHGDVHWPAWRKNVERVRRLGAELMGAAANEVALVRNTTEGIGLVAEGFDWQPGDNVVLPANEFPSNLYPWKQLASRGVEVRLVPVDNERLLPETVDRACDQRTRIVSLSWVGFATGWRIDPQVFSEIAHRHGALFFLDAIQAMGVLPLNVREAQIDFLAADGHKWMLGPEGAGLFYVSENRLDQLRPLLVGWNSVETAGDYTQSDMRLKRSAARYEGGSYNMAGIAGLAESLELLSHFGTETVASHLLSVTDELCEAIRRVGGEIASDRSEEHASGIVAFTLPGFPAGVVCEHLLASNVVVRERLGRLRASPHAYTNSDDIDRLIGGLKTLKSRR